MSSGIFLEILNSAVSYKRVVAKLYGAKITDKANENIYDE